MTLPISWPDNTDIAKYVGVLLELGFTQEENIHAHHGKEKWFCVEVKTDGNYEVYATPSAAAFFNPQGSFLTFA